MIEVFRTDVLENAQAHHLTNKLAGLLPHGMITFDLEDCDKVLRVESETICADAIISLMKANGFRCEILS